MSEPLTIGDLAARTGVAASALRYWEGLGLLPAPERVSGQRRYPASAARLVGVVVALRRVGFTLREIEAFLTPSAPGGDGWRPLYQAKLAELDERIAQAQAARTAIAHGLACPHDDIRDCAAFTAGADALLAGHTLEQAHEQAHTRARAR
ncbi:MerR family transcriptional regulator [Actinomadura litoris]|uniref:MerR family transcriptional regulator n=1 Tax=Actinomadura litoris TaxID=2678616 RepID=UPI001FA78768|nr:MerR family transcriptional regulator [Actinomadura litoris]